MFVWQIFLVFLFISLMKYLSTFVQTDVDMQKLRHKNSKVQMNRSKLKVFSVMLASAFEILVVRAPGTTKNVAGQPKILMQLSDGQP